MSEVRIHARTVGPGARGFLRVALVPPPGAGRPRTEVDVPAEALPAALRAPNATFVAVVDGRSFVRVEPEGEAWVAIQDRVRAVLNASWDPIGVADEVTDEYDSYVAPLHALLRDGASADRVAAALASIETRSMGLSPSRPERLRGVADELLALALPAVARPARD